MQTPDRSRDPLPDRRPFVPPLLARLRSETREAHDRIEANPALSCLLAPTLAVDAYVAALQGLYAFQAAINGRLRQLLQDVPKLEGPASDTLGALRADLAWFGAAIPRRVAGPRAISDRNSALGALYVVEGSALGGRVIGRAVAQSLAVAPGRGGEFFCGQTADHARLRWHSFCNLLAREGATGNEADAARVVAGARASFAFLDARLRGMSAQAGRDQPQTRRNAAPALPPPDGVAVRTMI